MSDTPKVKPYAVAMVFGAAPNGQVCNAIVGAATPEQASAQGVFSQLQATPHLLQLPLTGIAVMLLEDDLVRAMYGGLQGKAGEVVQLHAVGDAPRAYPVGDVRGMTPQELGRMPTPPPEPNPPEDAA
jgi:hypothetical protein